MKFHTLVLELKILQNLCNIHAARHFPKIVKSYSGDGKMSESIKSRNRKFPQIVIYLSIYLYIEKNRKEIVKHLKELPQCYAYYIIGRCYIVRKYYHRT